jgi:autotransporter translocation and assembly factor TamB
MTRLLLILGIMAVLTLTVFAVNISGTWNAKVDLGGQGGTPTFVLKQDGERLTGTYTGALGDAPLTGTIKADKIAFDFTVQGNKIHYEGTVNSDGTKMEGTCDYGGQASGTFTATKAR